MSLLSILAGGLPQPVYNPHAIGVATLVVATSEPGTTVEASVPMTITQTASGPALRIAVASDEHVEVSLPQLLDFVREASGIDVLELFGQMGALLG